MSVVASGPSTSMRRAVGRTAAMAALILASGCIIGASAASMMRGEPAPPAPDALPAGAEASKEIADRLRTRLGLTDAQAESVQRAFGARVEAIAAIRAELGRRLAAEHGNLERELRSTLSPQQYEQWREVLEDFRSSRRRRAGGWFGRGS